MEAQARLATLIAQCDEAQRGTDDQVAAVDPGDAEEAVRGYTAWAVSLGETADAQQFAHALAAGARRVARDAQAIERAAAAVAEEQGADAADVAEVADRAS